MEERIRGVMPNHCNVPLFYLNKIKKKKKKVKCMLFRRYFGSWRVFLPGPWPQHKSGVLLIYQLAMQLPWVWIERSCWLTFRQNVNLFTYHVVLEDLFRSPEALKSWSLWPLCGIWVIFLFIVLFSFSRRSGSFVRCLWGGFTFIFESKKKKNTQKTEVEHVSKFSWIYWDLST